MQTNRYILLKCHVFRVLPVRGVSVGYDYVIVIESYIVNVVVVVVINDSTLYYFFLSR